MSKRPVVEGLESRRLLSATPIVMAYVPDYQIGEGGSPVLSENASGTIVHDTVDWKGLTQVNYFALLPDATPGFAGSTAKARTATSDGGLQASTDSGYDPSVELPALVQDAKSHNVKVFVTVGAGDSNAIYDMDALVNTPSAWGTFAANIKNFCTKYGLAGVDLDWEPTGEAGFTVSATQIENFGNLVKTIHADDPALTLTSDALDDPVELSTSSGVDTGTAVYMLDETAVQNLAVINVEAYPASSVSEANSAMQAWDSYVIGGKDLQGIAINGKVSQLQYGLDISSDDTSNNPAGVIEGKVDTAIHNGYGGLFTFDIGSDTGNPSAIARISAEIAKDTATASTGGNVSGTVKSTHGAAVPGITVYLDANNNGKLDSNELHTVTTSNGAYSFSNVPAASYLIRQILPTGDWQVTPGSNYGIHISVTKGGSLTNENFTDAVPAELTGKLIGSLNALTKAASGHSASYAFDNKTSTTFEDTQANDNWIGLDLGSAFQITQIRYAADVADPYFMEGGIFQASNSADFSTGVVNLYQVPNTSTPSTNLTAITLKNTNKFRYVRYLAPAGSHGDVAEVEFFA